MNCYYLFIVFEWFYFLPNRFHQLFQNAYLLSMVKYQKKLNELLLPFYCDRLHLVVRVISVFSTIDSSQRGQPRVGRSCRGGRPSGFESQGCAVAVVVAVGGNFYSPPQYVLLATIKAHFDWKCILKLLSVLQNSETHKYKLFEKCYKTHTVKNIVSWLKYRWKCEKQLPSPSPPTHTKNLYP